jgi:hypothetical protein
MTNEEAEAFILAHPVSGGCGTYGAEKAAAADQANFTQYLMSQAKSVFGNDSAVFNTMFDNFSKILNAGPSQNGFSADLTSRMNARIIAQGANATRGIVASLGDKAATAGGGNVPVSGGAGINNKAAVEEQIAGQTANELTNVDIASAQAGQKNWETAAGGLSKAPGEFDNLSGLNAGVNTGLKQNMENAQAADAASNWWVKDATAVAGAGLNMLAPGLGNGLTGQKGGGGGGNFISNGLANGMRGGTTGGSPSNMGGSDSSNDGTGDSLYN